MRVTEALMDEIVQKSTFRAGDPAAERDANDPFVIRGVEEVLSFLEALPDTIPLPIIHPGVNLPEDSTIICLIWYGEPFIKRLLSMSFTGDGYVTMEYLNFEISKETRDTVSNVIRSLLENDMLMSQITQITSR